ncbi:coil containing protein [Vibrio phage 409E50-1]|nr:coil containing protein [Vibrio phage 521E56-1]CAH9013019.1 coil containing protein [Vibrio phage 384E50-1]CAH9013059.1 coil containing protein [Vibrio phage 409E50-1]CAH9013090.1 coil containing protein [Vibrio phage 402E50-1]CAH9013815.1 coil containing protein [Vibrio phage 405E50-1]CAH9013868.1 coil containing protein [Vibrio phage 413E50-1]
MKVDKFAEAFPLANGNEVLAVTWSNFMQRTRKGGVKVWRESSFSELMYVSEFYNMVEKRISNSVKSDKAELDAWMNKVCSDIERCLNGKDVDPFEPIDVSITFGDHRLARYRIRPMKPIQFTLNGAEYIESEDGLKRVGGDPWGYIPPKAANHDSMYGGNCANPDGTLKDEYDDTCEASWQTQDARAIIAERAQQAADAMAEAEKDDVPFSVVDGDDTSAPVVDKPSGKPDSNSDSDVKLSKAEQKELDKFGLTLDNLPALNEKPSGFRNKMWKQIHKKLK